MLWRALTAMVALSIKSGLILESLEVPSVRQSSEFLKTLLDGVRHAAEMDGNAVKVHLHDSCSLPVNSFLNPSLTVSISHHCPD